MILLRRRFVERDERVGEGGGGFRGEGGREGGREAGREAGRNGGIE